jgi:alkylation response protein AidB-like acyl-CoA dehydrogenase
MTAVAPTGSQPRGGQFLVASADGPILTAERLTPEQRTIRDSVRAFVDREVEPRRAALENGDHAAHRELLAILGRDGFVGIDVPDAFGGAGLDMTSSVVVTEAMGAAEPFSVTYAAHTGIGTLPLVFFGTDEQRQRYLPGLAAGTTVGAYALTEPGAGSDAQAIRTRAARQDDGSWRLDGTKQFITNAGFADLFTVYAKVDGEQFTAFLVDRVTEGLSIGPEEHKLGLHGASTCPLVLEGARVRSDNLLGEIGKGHRIAFNVLNMGRFKLAAAVLGAMKAGLATAAAYAHDRQAFGRPIEQFGLVGAKLAGMAASTYAVESVVYRIAGLIDSRIAGVESAGPDEVRAALEELAVECSIAKVFGSEALDGLVDELVQVHGGYGYLEDYPAARAYRDSRINRIWEGTNEINRLLIPGTLLKRALTGRLELLGPARRAQDELLAPSGETGIVDGLRQVALLLSGAAVQRFGTALEEQQELLAGLADLAITLFALESVELRAGQAAQDVPDRAEVHRGLAALVIEQRIGEAELLGRTLAATVAEGDDARMLQSGVRRLLRREPEDRVPLLRHVAAGVSRAGGYPIDASDGRTPAACRGPAASRAAGGIAAPAKETGREV